MSVVGIVSEYNPFHNGHRYHIEKSKELSGADFVICVMSGNFIQRGEPAIVDKWARTEMALSSGADLVIELPVVYAMASAEFFAYGAVKILDSTGITDYISFGSEAGSLHHLKLIAGILHTEPDDYKAALKASLSEGLSFPAAREKALTLWFKSAGCEDALSDMIKSPNNILAIEYIKALLKLDSKIIPQTVKRIQSSYNSEILEGAFSSATSIRKRILPKHSNNSLNAANPSDHLSLTEDLSFTMPEASFSILKREIKAGRGPISAENFENILLSSLRRMSVEEISRLPYIAEGLENRIKTAANNSGDLDTLLNAIGTKRYTRTRIQRNIFSLLTGVSNQDLAEFNTFGGPQYIRVLGFNSKGRTLLSDINKRASLPVIIKTADFKHSCNGLLSKMLNFEASSTDQYVLAFSAGENKKAGQEFTRNIIYL